MRAGVVHPAIVKNILWPDEAATQRFANALAAQPALHNAFIELRGELGAGKTTLVRHLLHALGITGRVKSPTYAVVEPYELPGLNIWHFDFYRFRDPLEWEDAGFRELFASPGLKLVEWPEKAADMIGCADLIIHLEAINEDTRKVTLTAQTQTGVALMGAAGLRDRIAGSAP